jgi:hypothetical protein
MPVIIRELIIKAEVPTDRSAQNGFSANNAVQLTQDERENLVKEITRQVLEELKLQKEP